MSTIEVPAPTPRESGYDIVVEPGALTRLGELVAEAAPAHRYAILADANVARLHGEAARAALERTGRRVDFVEVPAGEAHKSRETWAALTDALLELGLGRDAAIVSLGGGVCGDLAGFVAATYMRGLPVVHIPTSLLAMVDASVGGKAGVDSPLGKNLVGAFHPPRRVVIDPAVLSTLPAIELRNGLAEAVKHGAIADADYVAWIVERAAAWESREEEPLARLVRRSVEIKARFVSRDPFEKGARAALNFGHTVGHALERATGYTIPHGQAVAIGMCVEARAGELAGVTNAGAASALKTTLDALGLPTSVPPRVDARDVVEAARLDKKGRRGGTRYALIAEIGTIAGGDREGWTHPLDDDLVLAAIEECRDS